MSAHCGGGGHSGLGASKNKIFCLQILICWAQIDLWHLIRRTKVIESISETLLLIQILVWSYQVRPLISKSYLVKMRFFGYYAKPGDCGGVPYGSNEAFTSQLTWAKRPLVVSAGIKSLRGVPDLLYYIFFYKFFEIWNSVFDSSQKCLKLPKSTLALNKLSLEVLHNTVAQFFGFFGGSIWVSDHCARPPLTLRIQKNCHIKMQ